MVSYWIYGVILILIFYILCQHPSTKNSRFVFLFKLWRFPILACLFGMLCIPVFLFRPRSLKNPVFLSYLVSPLSIMMKIKWELRNGHILAEDRGCIVVANHQHSTDVLGLFTVWETMEKCTVVMKNLIFWILPYGIPAYLCGSTFIDRSKPKKAYETLEIISKLLHKDKIKIWFFPEGTRNYHKLGLLPFKQGAFKMAVQNQVPILPVVYSPYYFINEEKNIYSGGKIIMSCLEPIPTVGLTEENIPELIDRTSAIMEKHYRELWKEVVEPLPKDYPLRKLHIL